MVNRARRLVGLLITGTGAAFAIGVYGSSEGTVVSKADQGTYDYSCRAEGTVSGPVAVPAWGACSLPECWRIVVRDSDGNISEPCVSREEYDRTQLDQFWHEPTDWSIDH